jgi:GNAT superfamily N-acetyltransferase
MNVLRSIAEALPGVVAGKRGRELKNHSSRPLFPALKTYEEPSPEATMPSTIRRAVPADAATVVEFNQRLARETEGKALDPAVLAAGVAAALADPQVKGPYFLAVEGGTAVGQLGLTFEWSDWRNGWWWWIQSVYVVPEARGRGVFRALYEHVADLARRDPGVAGLRLYVERDNHAAQQTYRRLGMAASPYLLFERGPV